MASRAGVKTNGRRGDDSSVKARAPLIASQLRALRRQRGLTLQEVADQAGIGRSYLSRLERGEKAPSIATIVRLAESLGVQVSHLFGERLHDSLFLVTRRIDRGKVMLRGGPGGFAYELLACGDTGSMNAFLVYPDETTDENEVSGHKGEELIFVLKGAIKVVFADRSLALEEGDCLYFQADMPHQIKKVGRRACIALVVIGKR